MSENQHILLVNTPFPNTNSFCATGTSSGLATRVTMIQVFQWRLGESTTSKWTCFWFHFLYHSMWLLLGCIFNSTPCRIDVDIRPVQVPSCGIYTLWTCSYISHSYAELIILWARQRSNLPQCITYTAYDLSVKIWYSFNIKGITYYRSVPPKTVDQAFYLWVLEHYSSTLIGKYQIFNQTMHFASQQCIFTHSTFS
jgi:hypothetical protein